MSQKRGIFGGLVVVGLLLLLPGVLAAQSVTSATIAGTTKDTTGAVLPGVTVEASSPALIEKTRSAVTDAQGNYKILDLRPGQYTVTFTLPGFTTLKRDGLELATGLTANVTVEMRVGAVEETVTVTGASPVVDVQNVRYQQVLSREVWDALPTGKTLSSYVSLTLGCAHRGVRGFLASVHCDRSQPVENVSPRAPRRPGTDSRYDERPNGSDQEAPCIESRSHWRSRRQPPECSAWLAPHRQQTLNCAPHR